MDSIDELKFRILICLYKSLDSKNSVTGISRTLQQPKYSVSRAMIQMEREGLVDRSNNRAPKLTEEGKKTAAYYQDRVEVALDHLLYEGMDLESARRDSYILALRCSDEMINVMKKNDERYRVRRAFRDIKRFDGDILCKKMRDGTYNFPFIIYRENMKEKDIISMANRAFEHPCILNVADGKGTIQLRKLHILGKSAFNGMPMMGEVQKLEYYDCGTYVAAEMYGDLVAFPASALTFISMGEGTGENQTLHGGVSLRMQSTVREINMPQSTAYFSILI